MNKLYRKRLSGTELDYYDTRTAVNDIKPGAYETLPYTAKIHAENLVRKCDHQSLKESLIQLIDRKRDKDFPLVSRSVVP